MEVMNPTSAMCEPFPMAGMPMRMAMLHANAFLVDDVEEGGRGRNEISSPNMFMADVGTSVGDRQYLNAELMGTLERWTVPLAGNPNLLQVGEVDLQNRPFVDAQHPHSSPIMGLTLSDTISLERNKDYIKLFIAPRGSSTDGPIAFMHRPTAAYDPDAPLGHHVGQDVGHISSTVLGLALSVDRTVVEISAFNGREPLPDAVDLPLGTPDSYAVRLTRYFSPKIFAMVSAAVVRHPEPASPDLDQVVRYSGSVYGEHEWGGISFRDSAIYGLINFYDDTPALNSLLYEVLIPRKDFRYWSRFEYLQRTAAELGVSGASNPTQPQWVTAATLGITKIFSLPQGQEWGVGASVTKDFLPSLFESAYGGDPLSARIFLQYRAMKMLDLGGTVDQE